MASGANVSGNCEGNMVEICRKIFTGEIRLCAEILSEWGKQITGSFKTRINQHKKTMRTLKSRRDSRSLQQYSEAGKQLTEVYNQQEVF